MPPRRRPPNLPELFLGLLAIAVAGVVMTHILAHGLGGKLGRMRASSLGVFQVVPRDSTEVSDYGISDTSSREKDATAVVSAKFAVKQ